MASQESGHRWKLEDIYPDRQAWERALTGIERSVEDVAAFQGRLGDGAAVLAECLDTYFSLLRELYRVSSYASMRYHEDTRVDETAAMEQRVGLVSTRLSEAASFVEPELVALGGIRVQEYLSTEPALCDYGHHLEDILRRKAHTRSEGEEEVIAMTGLLTDAPPSAYSVLANADMPWPTVSLSDGTEVVLDQVKYTRYRSAPRREDREKIFRSFFGTWEAFSRTFAMLLYSQVKRDIFSARVRRYATSLEAALDPDRIPAQVYRTLVDQANAHLPVLHRYFKLRARLLGLDEMRYWDIYPPLVTGNPSYSIERASDLLLASAQPLGEEVYEAVRHGLSARWMDVYPRPGKKSGAYMNGHVYDVHPYILLNFNDDYESVSTLAHEWGHAIHSHLTNQSRPFAQADYSIFVAEVASTLNEALLLDRVLSEASDPRERLFYLGHALEQLRGTFFRQTMFAEFELAIHESVERGEALSADGFRSIYGDLLRRYHGHDSGVVTIDELFEVEWAYIPHFYYSFYVYKYATSVSASALIAERILAGEAEGVERYLELLRAGGSDYPYELLLRAGVDLARPEPYQALMRRMDGIMDEIELLLLQA